MISDNIISTFIHKNNKLVLFLTLFLNPGSVSGGSVVVVIVVVVVVVAFTALDSRAPSSSSLSVFADDRLPTLAPAPILAIALAPTLTLALVLALAMFE